MRVKIVKNIKFKTKIFYCSKLKNLKDFFIKTKGGKK